jgi:molybdate transport system substrate-binding protein
MKTVRRALSALCAVAMLVACGGGEPAPAAQGARPAVVFAAASLTDVLDEIGDLYAAAGHPEPRFSFAASSALARQVEQGAEADVILSADEDWMNYLAERNLIDPATRETLLTNTLVLVAPAGAPFQLTLEPGMDLAGALKDGRLSLADPASVPAGKYAREALEALGAWSAVETSVVRAENVRAALRFVETGDAAAGIVYGTDAQAAGASVVLVGTFPAGSHTPVSYPAALLAGRGDGPGRAFLDFLRSEQAQEVFQAAGFGTGQ